MTMPSERWPESRFPPEIVPDRAVVPDDYDAYAEKLPGQPLTTEQLNRRGDFAVCKAQHGGHKFGDDGQCSGCPMTLEEFKRMGGLVF